MTSVPKETVLMVTVQRAANLPARLAEGAAAAGARGAWVGALREWS
jgi:hypothetical protein